MRLCLFYNTFLERIPVFCLFKDTWKLAVGHLKVGYLLFSMSGYND